MKRKQGSVQRPPAPWRRCSFCNCSEEDTDHLSPIIINRVQQLACSDCYERRRPLTMVEQAVVDRAEGPTPARHEGEHAIDYVSRAMRARHTERKET